jgi:putative transposase
MSDDWRSGRHVVYQLHAHIVLTPKYRKKVMTKRVTEDLRASFEEVCGRYEATLDEFETDAGHAHLLVTYPPKVALSTLVMSLKTISSYRVRQHRWPEVQKALWGTHFWSPSYAVVSCGGAPLEHVKEYIRSQQTPQHQAKRAVKSLERRAP